MTSSATPQSEALALKPQFGATVICNRHVAIRLTQLIAALRTIAPSSAMGDWQGPFTARPSDAYGTGMISIDGVPLTLLEINAPLPAPFFNTGAIPNHLMPDPLNELRDHRAHVFVMPAREPQGRVAAIATARAVTLLAWAVALVTGAGAFKWTDANNFAPVSLLQDCAPNLLRTGGLAMPAWVRILAGRAQGQQKVIAGSYGLWAFALPEIEYAPTDLPMHYLVPHAYAVCAFLLRSSKPGRLHEVRHNDIIDVDGENAFKVETLDHGFFGKAPALRLSLLRPGIVRDPNRR
jgi:hypothetical protein